MELIEFGGMTPTSVTTAVMEVGGVRSYNGLRISRFGRFWSVKASRGFVRGKDENKSPIGAGYPDVCQLLGMEDTLSTTHLVHSL